MDVIFKQGPECHKLFTSSISGVTPGDTDDRFNTSSHALDVGSGVVGLYAIPGAMLLTILLIVGVEDVSDILIDPECPTSSQLN